MGLWLLAGCGKADTGAASSGPLDDGFAGAGGAAPARVPADSPTGFELHDMTVGDPRTGLEWQRAVAPDDFTPARPFSDPNNAAAADAAAAYCAALELDGRSDWRLPNRLELVSIVDFARIDPTLDTEVFLDQPAQGDFWTSSHWVKDDIPYAVGLHDGYVTFDGDIQGECFARCVRGTELPTTASAADFDLSDTAARDRRHGLVWQRAASPRGFESPSAAAAHCAGLTAPGARPWRLPTVKELHTLIRERTNIAVDDTVFPDTGSGDYWTSTPFRRFADGTVWVVNFGTGASYGSWSNSGRARCVHE